MSWQVVIQSVPTLSTRKNEHKMTKLLWIVGIKNQDVVNLKTLLSPAPTVWFGSGLMNVWVWSVTTKRVRNYVACNRCLVRNIKTARPFRALGRSLSCTRTPPSASPPSPHHHHTHTLTHTHTPPSPHPNHPPHTLQPQRQPTHQPTQQKPTHTHTPTRLEGEWRLRSLVSSRAVDRPHGPDRSRPPQLRQGGGWRDVQRLTTTGDGQGRWVAAGCT